MAAPMQIVKVIFLYLVPAPVVIAAVNDLLHGNQNSAPFLIAIVIMYYAIMRKIDVLSFRVTDLEKRMDR